jgi:hypothetical protein
MQLTLAPWVAQQYILMFPAKEAKIATDIRASHEFLHLRISDVNVP